MSFWNTPMIIGLVIYLFIGVRHIRNEEKRIRSLTLAVISIAILYWLHSILSTDAFLIGGIIDWVILVGSLILTGIVSLLLRPIFRHVLPKSLSGGSHLPNCPPNQFWNPDTDQCELRK